ncbi:hypothetical protein RHGRI_020694 [Rhododendron griersonianum]|uniref:Pleiotropic ABC efflux transporter N-terminal domain-containing protein n=1 Tax=Rhododendron griersonianum TaxID=479676 RepID=A0AAV6JJ99_9ERIC|nr:hypothetical protein RHGRI_020694 [Rhododendron griersonianum]
MDGGENVIRAISTRWSSSTIWRGNELYSFSSNEEQDEEALKWAALENLPTFARIRKGILSDEEGQIREIDVKNLGIIEKRNLVERLLEIAEEGNKNFLLKLKKRIDRVGINLPTIEVRFEHLNVDAETYAGGRALPTVSNFFVNIFQVSGNVTYNGCGMNEFVPQRTSAYTSQHDLHIGELTVRDTLAFSARCQGVGSRYELSRREKEANIMPDPDLDIYMKALSLEGQKANVAIDYVLKVFY